MIGIEIRYNNKNSIFHIYSDNKLSIILYDSSGTFHSLTKMLHKLYGISFTEIEKALVDALHKDYNYIEFGFNRTYVVGSQKQNNH